MTTRGLSTPDSLPTFRENRYRRGEAFILASILAVALDLFLLEPHELGANQRLDNFVPLEIDLSSTTVSQLGCFLVESVFDIVSDQAQPTISYNYELFEGFVKGILASLVTNDGFFNCPTLSFVRPGENTARSSHGSQSSQGFLINVTILALASSLTLQSSERQGRVISRGR
ncbi:hypothetical protein N7532_010602 [Penicillium argentinense]|uniref:Uncharacterized protein n=1 Tax=Penicillium argentinense TaxID=1131581 RepID=A0A9W9JYA8_9EURO|nr:uncharacterized protein N7532_010602 [Penicillium argentinense]KAJ5085831.1 hypothetical protein N7532_010602 [Penicillium argentinense]